MIHRSLRLISAFWIPVLVLIAIAGRANAQEPDVPGRQDADEHYRRGEALRDEGKLLDAAAAFQAAADAMYREDRFQHGISARMHAAKCLRDARNFGGQLEALKLAASDLEAHSDSAGLEWIRVDIASKQANCLLNLGRLDDSVACGIRALALARTSGEDPKLLRYIYNTLARGMYALGRPASALEYLERARNLLPLDHPLRPIVESNIAGTLGELGDHEGALGAYDRVEDALRNRDDETANQLAINARRGRGTILMRLRRHADRRRRGVRRTGGRASGSSPSRAPRRRSASRRCGGRAPAR